MRRGSSGEQKDHFVPMPGNCMQMGVKHQEEKGGATLQVLGVQKAVDKTALQQSTSITRDDSFELNTSSVGSVSSDNESVYRRNGIIIKKSSKAQSTEQRSL